MSSNGRLQAYLDANRDRFRDELFEFLRIPSVSARSEHRADTRRCAEWLMEKMKEAGL
jgi:acetylornithine deacetylase/succinyl-diaminopimelate desuccinylase-like protein